ncbi:MAG TPA: BamA/TamA family outer membrane protein, partial [Candidatus Cloacimonadota bacterium]|nr:BamA/TamA family outer membrane protein [Candidatus Cloacimonadota bacterium]
AELRYRLTEDSRLYLFYDHGIQMTEQEQTNYRLFSLGMGLSYRTRIGILRLDYALGYKDKNMWDFGLGIIHLGLDAAF